MNDNQNYRVQDGRTTSRVLAPPGGRSTITLGLDPNPPVKKKEPEPPQQVKESQEETTTTTTTTSSDPPSAHNNSKTETSSSSRPVSSNAFAASSNMNGAQVMTGRPTSRVLHPGGGGGPTQWKLG